MRGLFIGLVVAVAAFTPIAWGFGTVHGLRGQDAEHERITRHALGGIFESKTLTMVAGGPGYFGAVGAPDDPTRGLMSEEAAHCDGGDHFAAPGYPQSKQAAAAAITRCRQWMNDHLNAAVDMASALIKNGKIDGSQIPTMVRCVFDGHPGRAKCNVLEEFGLTLHTAQDFYSHSNWADKTTGGVSVGNPPGLGNSGRARGSTSGNKALRFPTA